MTTAKTFTAADLAMTMQAHVGERWFGEDVEKGSEAMGDDVIGVLVRYADGDGDDWEIEYDGDYEFIDAIDDVLVLVVNDRVVARWKMVDGVLVHHR